MAAAKDIWKLGPSRLSGWISSTTVAPQASMRNDMPRRSTMTAISTMAAIRKARWVGTVAPAIRA